MLYDLLLPEYEIYVCPHKEINIQSPDKMVGPTDYLREKL